MARLEEPILSDAERQRTREAFRGRLGVYLLGISVGCVLLGLFWMARPSARPPNGPAAALPPGGKTDGR